MHYACRPLTGALLNIPEGGRNITADGIPIDRYNVSCSSPGVRCVRDEAGLEGKGKGMGWREGGRAGLMTGEDGREQCRQGRAGQGTVGLSRHRCASYECQAGKRPWFMKQWAALTVGL